MILSMDLLVYAINLRCCYCVRDKIFSFFFEKIKFVGYYTHDLN